MSLGEGAGNSKPRGGREQGRLGRLPLHQLQPASQVKKKFLAIWSCFSTINVPLKWQVNLGFKAPKLIEKKNNSWLIRPEEEVVSAHILLTFDVRLQRCQLLLLWKKCIEQCVQVQQCPDDRNASFRRLWLSRCLSSHCENLYFLTKQIFYFSFSN